MVIEIRSSNVNLRSNMRTYIEERLDRSLARVGNSVTHVILHLEDVNGPKGGADMRCMVEAHLAHSKPVIAEVTAGDIRTAVDMAAERLSFRVRKAIDRRRETRRHAARQLVEQVTAG